jgi:inosose dehydratase
MAMTRRSLLAMGAVAGAAGAKSHYRVGITNNTRGGWEKDFWLASRESREVGYKRVETFISYLWDSMDRPAEILRKASATGVSFVTVSNAGPMEMHFEDPASHAKILEEHTRLAGFVNALGCDHLKINMGPRRAHGTTDEDLKRMAEVIGKLGRRTAVEGVRLAIHAHMWSQFENRREVDYMMRHTDAKDVAFVLDTGHVTMAGMDPLALFRELGHRVVEFHLKDTAPETRGGVKQRIDRPDMMLHPVFFPLGTGGVDFEGLKAHGDKIGWRGHWTVELDTSPFRPPKESAAMSLGYLRQKFGLDG